MRTLPQSSTASFGFTELQTSHRIPILFSFSTTMSETNRTTTPGGNNGTSPLPQAARTTEGANTWPYATSTGAYGETVADAELKKSFLQQESYYEKVRVGTRGLKEQFAREAGENSGGVGPETLSGLSKLRICLENTGDNLKTYLAANWRVWETMQIQTFNSEDDLQALWSHIQTQTELRTLIRSTLALTSQVLEVDPQQEITSISGAAQEERGKDQVLADLGSILSTHMRLANDQSDLQLHLCSCFDDMKETGKSQLPMSNYLS